MKEITITFEGYWRFTERILIPAIAGIYCVYEGGYDISKKEIILYRLIDIGASENIRETILLHEDDDNWSSEVFGDHELCFSVGSVPAEDRERALQALLYVHKPIAHSDQLEWFPYKDTNLFLLGKKDLLNPYFTVYRETWSKNPMNEQVEV